MGFSDAMEGLFLENINLKYTNIALRTEVENRANAHSHMQEETRCLEAENNLLLAFDEDKKKFQKLRILRLKEVNQVLNAENKKLEEANQAFRVGSDIAHGTIVDPKAENEGLKIELKLKGRYGPYPLHVMNMFLVTEQMKNKNLGAEK